MPDGYVYRAEPACLDSGCMLSAASGMLRQAQEIIRQNGRDGMSAALWCEQGGHAFSERDPGRQRISINTLDEEENEVVVAKDFCGDCAADAGLTSPRKTKPAIALTAAAQEAAEAEAADDHEMLRQLQRELADLKAQKAAQGDHA